MDKDTKGRVITVDQVSEYLKPGSFVGFLFTKDSKPVSMLVIPSTDPDTICIQSIENPSIFVFNPPLKSIAWVSEILQVNHPKDYATTDVVSDKI